MAALNFVSVPPRFIRIVLGAILIQCPLRQSWRATIMAVPYSTLQRSAVTLER